ncbi:hypothetical protein [Methylocaldum szegediense]|uniref:hypothetical protein n=1 Tax=Methylocaldum szegediense TaxID=73780 RepID=UPI0004042DFF|nr:hypothetical protein [Methylocaldum szegediense]
MKRILCLFTPILFFTIPALAQLEGNSDNLCNGELFSIENDNYRIAKVKGKKGEKVFFYAGERADCPENENCRKKSYVIPDDEVIVSRTFGNWACSLYQPKKGYETVGWIAVDKLEFLETKTDVSKNDWLGDWTYFVDRTGDGYRSRIRNTIRIGAGKTDEFLSIKGDANWYGPDDNAHEGELDYEVKPNGNIRVVSDAKQL